MPNDIANNMAETIRFLEEENASLMKAQVDLQLAYNEQMIELRKAKELLRDIKAYYRSDSKCKEYKCADCTHFDECGYGKKHPDGYKWRFEDDVNALIGGNDESEN